MKAVFVHDARYIQTKDGIYAETEFSAESWKPYLKHFDELVVIGRNHRAELSQSVELNVYNRCNHGNVSFALFPSLTDPTNFFFKRMEIAKKIKAIIAASDAVILRGVQENAVLAYKAAKEAGKPVALEGTGCMWNNTWYYGTLAGKLYAPFRFINAKIVFKNADAVLYVTDHFLQNRYPTKGIKINAIDAKLQKPDELVLKTRLEKIDNRDDHAPLKFGIIGALHHGHKGINDAIKTLARWHKTTGYAFNLHILGRGDHTKLKRLANQYGIEKYVCFDGLIAHYQISQWLDDLDIYLQPSHADSLPRATLEAMSRALPVITSNVGDLPYVVDQNFTHNRRDIKKTAALIEKLSDSKNIQKTQAKRNFETIKSSFDPEYLSKKREQFWAQFFEIAKERKAAQAPFK